VLERRRHEGIYVRSSRTGQQRLREDAARILQKLFERLPLSFYNAKFDRKFSAHPRLDSSLSAFEDVQVLKYINDPRPISETRVSIAAMPKA